MRTGQAAHYSPVSCCCLILSLLRSRLLRLLTPTLLSLGACAIALSSLSVAEARPRHKPAKASATAKSAADLKPLVFFNADGSPHTPTLEDAPAGDYERVAWCHGILTGDMELAEQISSLEPVDARIQTIGRSYLRAYEAALTLSGKGQSTEGHALAEAARQRGYDGWNGARKAEIHKAAYAYDTWQLPGDCEHAAVRLSGRDNLFAELATDEEAKAISDALNSGGAHDYKDLPKPKLTAQTVAPDSDAPIATNTLARRASQATTLPVAKPDAATASQPGDAGAAKSN